MSEAVRKRLYIGGLTSGISEDEISERFSRFGKVSNLSLKTRQDEDGNCIKVFAHLDVEGSEENIKKCFNTYQGTKWKGSVLRLQYAKESFLTRLSKEREEEQSRTKETSPTKEKMSAGEWKAPDFSELKGPAVPGTQVPGKKDWVVGKYGRVLPVLNVKMSYKVKAIKHDPSKYCHAARVFKDENKEGASNASCDDLTWEITQPDSEITKKRKGEFPPSPANKKPRKILTPELRDSFSSGALKSKNVQKIANDVDDFEVVRIGQSKTSTVRNSAPSRFDSDFEEDSESDDENTSLESKFNHHPSKEHLHNNPESKIIESSNKNCKEPVAEKLNEAMKKKPIVSSDTEDIVNKASKSNQSPTKQKTAVTATSTLGRKVPEFGGLGMLTSANISNLSSQSQECRTTHRGSLMNKKESKAENQEEEKSMTSAGEEESFSFKNSPTSKMKDLKTHPSDAKQHEKNNPKVKQSNKKKLKKEKMAQESSSPIVEGTSNMPSGHVSDNSSKTVAEADGNDSASSADTDEIIAWHKSKEDAETPAIARKRFPSSKNSLLNQSVDLSEFSASAPEIVCNSIGNSSNLNSSVASDSYDSDLDSNDFELVAKKLAQKAKKSQQMSANKSQRKPAAIKGLSELHKNSAKKPELVLERGDNSISDMKKLHEDNVQDFSEETHVQSKLLEIAKSTGKPGDEKTSPEKTPMIKQNKHVADNEKRLQALNQQKRMKDKQKQIVKTALENVESASTKRIVFSSSDEDDYEGDESSTVQVQAKTSPLKASEPKSEKDSKKSSSKLTLLDSSSSDESDYEEMFKSKPQFEGKKGEKLMAMQRKIDDSRFQMDEKFLESEDSEDEKNETENNDSFADEKKINLEILDNVVGKSKMDQFTAKLKKKTKHIIDMNAIRFDPTKLKAPEQKPDQRDEESSRSEEEEEEMEVDEPSSPHDVSKENEKTKRKEEKGTKKQESSKSSVMMSSSLVDMLKSQAKEEDKEKAGDATFSLLHQFDQDEDDEENSEDDEENSNERDESTSAPLSGLKSKDETETAEQMEEDNMFESSDENNVTETSDSDVKSETSESVPEKEPGEVEVEINEASGTSLLAPEDPDSSSQEEDDSDGKNDLQSITAQLDPQKEKERALLNAGRTDIRFTKDTWLERWDEIRSDLMKMCRRKHKDAGKRKRVMNEKKRKNDILKNFKRKPWLKRSGI